MRYTHKQAGFTILELMIATMVFSVILLLATYGIIRIGNRYYKASLDTQTQATVRNTVEEISRSIQFTGGSSTSLSPVTASSGGKGAYCVGDTKYAFKLHAQQGIDEGQTPHVLIASPFSGGNCGVPTDEDFTGQLGADDRSLLADRMRLADFTVAALADGTFKVSMRVASGANDLLCSPSPSDNDCASTGTSEHLDNPVLQCRGGAGSQFCSVSALSTVVTKRLQ